MDLPSLSSAEAITSSPYPIDHRLITTPPNPPPTSSPLRYITSATNDIITTTIGRGKHHPTHARPPPISTIFAPHLPPYQPRHHHPRYHLPTRATITTDPIPSCHHHHAITTMATPPQPPLSRHPHRHLNHATTTANPTPPTSSSPPSPPIYHKARAAFGLISAIRVRLVVAVAASCRPMERLVLYKSRLWCVWLDTQIKDAFGLRRNGKGFKASRRLFVYKVSLLLRLIVMDDIVTRQQQQQTMNEYDE
nr:hypothetical protein [Tanacetum cinerariifolium]